MNIVFLLVILVAAWVLLKFVFKQAVLAAKKILIKVAAVVLVAAVVAWAGFAAADALGGPVALFFAVALGAGALLMFYFFQAKPQSGAADVLVDAASMRQLAGTYDPAPYITAAKPGEIFMGLDERSKPVVRPQRFFSKNHIEILGESGVGKSSLAGVLLSQLAAAGECVVVFDPKLDRMLPGVLARAGREYGFPIINIDLRYGQPAQINPFLGARQDQVEELLQVALDLGKTGQGAVDFYRGEDREATVFMAQAFADGETSMPELLEMAAEDERVTQNKNLWREFKQLSRINAFKVHQGQGGHDLEQLLSRPGVVYVTGSTTKLEVQAAQKLMFQRILQILDERRDQSMPVAIFLDELKYILSPAALRAAGTIRDRNCHLIFAHQSLGDLSDCPGLDPKAVRGAVWGNCGLKICYRMLDEPTARELSGISGDRAILESRTTEKDGEVSVGKSVGKVTHMPPHIFTHLPKPIGDEASVGVVIGDGPAYFLSTRWLASGPAPEPIPAGQQEQAAADEQPIAADLSQLDHAPDPSATPAADPQPAQEDAILTADFDDFLK